MTSALRGVAELFASGLPGVREGDDSRSSISLRSLSLSAPFAPSLAWTIRAIGAAWVRKLALMGRARVSGRAGVQWTRRRQRRNRRRCRVSICSSPSRLFAHLAAALLLVGNPARDSTHLPTAAQRSRQRAGRQAGVVTERPPPATSATH